ncbi:MAG: Ribosomal RNA small subunit methyltransferase C, partial [uncultured Acidimicrobiales bacterium]
APVLRPSSRGRQPAPTGRAGPARPGPHGDADHGDGGVLRGPGGSRHPRPDRQRTAGSVGRRPAGPGVRLRPSGGDPRPAFAGGAGVGGRRERAGGGAVHPERRSPRPWTGAAAGLHPRRGARRHPLRGPVVQPPDPHRRRRASPAPARLAGPPRRSGPGCTGGATSPRGGLARSLARRPGLGGGAAGVQARVPHPGRDAVV